MALLAPNEGEMKMLEAIVNKTAPENLVIGLFKSNTTPAETDTVATYTEASFTGYSAQTLTGASWGSAVSGSPSTITYGSQLTFTASAGSQIDDIYGYFVKQTTSGKLMWAERDASAPIGIRNNGDAIKITPVLGLD